MNKIMPELDIREDFPIFQANPELVYLDSSSTTLVPETVITASSEFLRKITVSSRRGAYQLAAKGGQIAEDARKQLASMLGSNNNQISFHGSLPSAITSVALGYNWESGKKDSIIVSEAEHNSVMIPLRRVAEILNIDVHIIQTDENGVLDIQELDRITNNRTGIVAVSEWVPGTDRRNPLKSISKITHESDALFLTEASREIAFSEDISFPSLADVAFFSSNRGLMAPPETTIQWTSKEMASGIKPGILGANSVSIVEESSFETALPPDRFESGILPLSNIAAINEAINYTEGLRNKGLRKHMKNLSQYLVESLNEIPSLNLYGNPTDENVSVIFNIGEDSGVSCHDIALFLNQSNIAVRSGLLCTSLLVKKYSNTGVVQVSLHGYNTISDIHKLSKQLNLITSQLI
ncbi:aminotransferase class V-fold PLP-dependent enzyme [Candidatus Thorarchaeota archaeon]|nr:MAG: aminotransferase class V-fold PLP-dependent enzyme [Candidatus Thorarchaeota archaeon]